MIIFRNDTTAEFIKRPNRFIIIAMVDGKEVTCHCPNTGRMGELLHPGVKLILEKSDNPKRKTPYSVVAVYKGELIVPIASVRANKVAGELIIPQLFDKPEIKSEVTYNKSRFDFMVDNSGERTFIEVKSCTLFIDDYAVFPDAPTSRGVKHLNELDESLSEGYKAMVILVVFNPYSVAFSPNHITDPKFAQTMKSLDGRVKIIPFKVSVDSSGVVKPAENPVLPVDYNGTWEFDR